MPPYAKILAEAFPNAEVILLTKGDPHNYKLTPEDIQLLKSLTDSDVVVVTEHLPVEQEIAEMAKRGELKARYIKALGVVLTLDGKKITITEHDHIHDDENLIIGPHGLYPPNILRLIDEITKATGLQPDPAFVNELRSLRERYEGKFSGKAVAITPGAYYILTWLGFDDVALLIKEHDEPPTEEDWEKALRYAGEGAPVLTVAWGRNAWVITEAFKKKAAEAGIEVRVVTMNLTKGYIGELRNAVEAITKIASSGK